MFTMHQLMASLNQKVFPSHEAEGVAADWSKLGLMSHSLGAQYITEMLQKNSTFAKVRNITRGSINIIAEVFELFYL